MAEEGYLGSPRHFDIRDEQLELFLEEEMRRHYGVIGASECQHLRIQLGEAKKNDPYAFEHLLRQLLKKYMKLSLKVRRIKKRKTVQDGPPDRFFELRKRNRVLGYHR
jgi:hypothetical protein